MKKDIDIKKIKLYCTIDRKRIPLERILRRSSTCCKDCQKSLRDFRLAIIESRKCLHCYKPSSPADRALYRRFKAWLLEQGVISVPKTGRPCKKPVDGIPTVL